MKFLKTGCVDIGLNDDTYILEYVHEFVQSEFRQINGQPSKHWNSVCEQSSRKIDAFVDIAITATYTLPIINFNSISNGTGRCFYLRIIWTILNVRSQLVAIKSNERFGAFYFKPKRNYSSTHTIVHLSSRIVRPYAFRAYDYSSLVSDLFQRKMINIGYWRRQPRKIFIGDLHKY